MRAACALFLLSACGGGGGVQPDMSGGFDLALAAGITAIELTVSDSQLCAGDSAVITVTALDSDGKTVPLNGSISWSSSNPQVATVDNGAIHALAPGSATITGSYGGISGSLAILVISPTLTIGPNPMTVTLTGCPEQLALGVTGKCAGVPFSVRTIDNDVVLDNPSGTIPQNGFAYVKVQANPQLIGGTPSLTGVTTSIVVDTPGASTAVGVGFVDEQSLLGDWQGTWEASSTHTLADTTVLTGPAGLGGTWTLSIGGIDTTSNTVSGSIHWVGSDNYWTCNADNSMAGPMSFAVDRTLALDSSNSMFQSADTMSCNGYPYQINFRVDDIPPSPSPEYVLNFGAGFDPAINTELGSCGTFPQPADVCGFNGTSGTSCKVTGMR